MAQCMMARMSTNFLIMLVGANGKFANQNECIDVLCMLAPIYTSGAMWQEFPLSVICTVEMHKSKRRFSVEPLIKEKTVKKV